MKKLIILSGPSGVGKGTIVKRLLSLGDYALSVSCTTRSPRPGEKDGEAYFFITKQKFFELIENNGLLEYDEHFGNYYGTPREFVINKLQTKHVILEIEVNGALKVKEAYPDAILVMIVPPSVDELVSRLKHRGSENEENIQNRLSRMDYELSLKDKYDFVIVNDSLEKAVNEIKNIIES